MVLCNIVAAVLRWVVAGPGPGSHVLGRVVAGPGPGSNVLWQLTAECRVPSAVGGLPGVQRARAIAVTAECTGPIAIAGYCGVQGSCAVVGYCGVESKAMGWVTAQQRVMR